MATEEMLAHLRRSDLQKTRENESQEEAQGTGEADDGGQIVEGSGQNDGRNGSSQAANPSDSAAGAILGPVQGQTEIEIIAQGDSVQRKSRQNIKDRKHDDDVGNDAGEDGVVTAAIKTQTSVVDPVEGHQRVGACSEIEGCQQTEHRIKGEGDGKASEEHGAQFGFVVHMLGQTWHRVVHHLSKDSH